MVKVLLLVLAASALAAADAVLELPAQIAPGTATIGTVVVSEAPAGVHSLEFPDLPGVTFQLAGGSVVQTTITNGVANRSERISIAITPTRTGPLTISGLTAVLRDGTRLTAPDLIVQVTSGDAGLTGEAQFTVSFSAPTAWVGQPVTMEFRAALSSENLQLDKIDLAPPSQATVLADPPKEDGSTLAADGTRWHTITKRWTLSFSAPGTVEVRGQQDYYRCRRDVFDRWMAIGGPRHAAIRPATLVVREVPAAGRPPDWSGVVGAVTVEAALDRARIAAGEGARLTVTVHGPQAPQMGRPALPAVPGLRAYPRDDGAAAPGADERSFAWDLVPAAPGRYAVPAPSVPWFDTASETFARAEAKPLTLEVLPGRSQGLSVAGSAPARSERVDVPSVDLPGPLRGRGQAAPAPTTVLAALAAALLAGLGWGWGSARMPRARRGQHGGRALAAALRSGDLPAAAAALQSLRPRLASEAQRDAARRLDERLAVARFGGGELGAIDAELAALEGVP